MTFLILIESQACTQDDRKQTRIRWNSSWPRRRGGWGALNDCDAICFHFISLYISHCFFIVLLFPLLSLSLSNCHLLTLSINLLFIFSFSIYPFFFFFLLLCALSLSLIALVSQGTMVFIGSFFVVSYICMQSWNKMMNLSHNVRKNSSQTQLYDKNIMLQ